MKSETEIRKKIDELEEDMNGEYKDIFDHDNLLIFQDALRWVLE
jgi:hypothetical protein